jgi:histone H3/H4
MSSEVYDEMRISLLKGLENLLVKTLLYVSHARRSTVRPNDVVKGYKIFGKHFYGVSERNTYDRSPKIKIYAAGTNKKNKRKKGNRSISEMRFYQRQVGVFFSYKTFGNLVREKAYQFDNTHVRFGEGSLDVLQEIIEAELKKLAANSQLCCLNRVSRVLKPKDVNLALKIMSEQKNSIFKKQTKDK